MLAEGETILGIATELLHQLEQGEALPRQRRSRGDSSAPGVSARAAVGSSASCGGRPAGASGQSKGQSNHHGVVTRGSFLAVFCGPGPNAPLPLEVPRKDYPGAGKTRGWTRYYKDWCGWMTTTRTAVCR